MPLIKYRDVKFHRSTLLQIQMANAIIEEYQQQGFDLTLRQLYYQFVSRDIIPNTLRAYKQLGAVVNDARLAGLIDWNAIVDRTRYLRALPHWSSPADIVRAGAQQFRIDRWENQRYRPEVWIEKDALVGVISQVCNSLSVPYFSCRGYTSQSEMWAAAQRLEGYGDHTPVIFHFGDHDPSGLDMTRDITDRLEMFMGGMRVERLALNYDQVLQYKPPPNPAKTTDARAKAYIKEFGHESWELDALSPTTLAALIRGEIEALQDKKIWKADEQVEKNGRSELSSVAGDWRKAVDAVA